MQELILAQTSLPNLHPAIVHFPIVLLIVALLLDIVALFAGSRIWLRNAAILLSVLGAVAAGVTFWMIAVNLQVWFRWSITRQMKDLTTFR